MLLLFLTADLSARIEFVEIKTLNKIQKKKDQLLRLIEESFNYKEGHSFEIDFAPLFTKKNEEHLYVLLDKNTIIGHIGCLPKKLLYKDMSTDILMIGGICIHKEYRGKGLFKKLMNHVLENYSKKVSMFMLWGNEKELYEKYHFYFSGLLFQGKAENNNPRFNKTTYSQVSTQIKDKIKNYYQKLSERYWIIQRTDEDWKTIENITSAHLYLNNDENTFFFKNKGLDLQGIVYEAYGENLDELLNHDTWLPLQDEIILSNLKAFPLAMMRIGNHALFKEFIIMATNNQVQIEIILDNEIQFNFQGNSHNLSHEDFLTGLFGPYPIEEFQTIMPEFLISGLDSI